MFENILGEIDFIFFKIKLAIKRIPCVINGCKTYFETGYNMPDDWHSPEFCKICDATFDAYGYEETPWHVLYSSDGFLYRFKEWLIWDER